MAPLGKIQVNLPVTVHLEMDLKPTNQTRYTHRAERSRRTREIRFFSKLQFQSRMATLGGCGLKTAVCAVVQIAKPKPKTLPDVGNISDPVKAAIDGAVDAGVLPDDSPKHLSALLYISPVHSERLMPGMTIIFAETLSEALAEVEATLAANDGN